MNATASEVVLARSGRTFHLASRFLPRGMRDDAAELYAFCRRMDDLADEGGPDGKEELERVTVLLESDPAGPSILSMGWPVHLERRFPQISKTAAQLTRALADDAGPRRIATETELESYAWGVAGTVGIMMARLLGAPPEAAASAAALGMGMQLTNISRDVREDLERDRIYLPASWIAPHAVKSAVAGGEPAPLVEATQKLLRAAESLYSAGRKGIHFLPWRARPGILAAAACYREIGICVSRDIPRSWRERVVVSPGCKASLALIAFAHALRIRETQEESDAVFFAGDQDQAMKPDTDVAILGAGCAGLSLAAALSTERVPGRVLLLEPRTTYTRDRTWCFWNTENHPFAAAISYSWNSWRVSDNHRVALQQSDQYRYCHIAGDDFYQVALSSIENSPEQQIYRGVSVISITPHASGLVSIETTSGHILAREVFDSRPPVATDNTPPLLLQRFVGWHIRTATPRFNATVELMRFLPSDMPGRIRFLYLLPFSSNEALVEMTYLDDANLPLPDAEGDLVAWLEDHAGQWQVLYSEAGSLPMAPLTETISTLLPHVHAIGIRGGRLKPSSGYAFLRIQRHSRAIAKALSSGLAIPQTAEPRLYSTMDALFLRALRNGSGADLFLSMFERTEPDALVRFLSEISPVAEMLQVAWSLPKLPMMRSILSRGRAA